MRHGRRGFVAALAALALALPCIATAQDAALAEADWREIRRVVADQRAALVAGEGERAFGHASPGIRRQFGDAARFLAMVRSSYADLVDATDTAFVDGAVIDGHVIQPLRLTLPGGTVRVALYTMEKQPDGRWRISGCAIAPSTFRSA
jgi:ketosteroid isomerase-like protein